MGMGTINTPNNTLIFMDIHPQEKQAQADKLSMGLLTSSIGISTNIQAKCGSPYILYKYFNKYTS